MDLYHLRYVKDGEEYYLMPQRLLGLASGYVTFWIAVSIKALQYPPVESYDCFTLRIVRD